MNILCSVFQYSGTHKLHSLIKFKFLASCTGWSLRHDVPKIRPSLPFEFKRHVVCRNCTERRRFVLIDKPLADSSARSGNHSSPVELCELLTELSEFGVTTAIPHPSDPPWCHSRFTRERLYCCQLSSRNSNRHILRVSKCRCAPPVRFFYNSPLLADEHVPQYSLSFRRDDDNMSLTSFLQSRPQHCHGPIWPMVPDRNDLTQPQSVPRKNAIMNPIW